MVIGQAVHEVTWTAHVPIAGSDAGGEFGIQLAIADDQPATFVSVGDSGRFSRVLLARLAGPEGRTARMICLKLQRDHYRSLTAAAAAIIDNREIDAMWRRELEQLERLAGRGAPMVLAKGPDGGVLPPMAYDRRSGAVFPIVCPRTWRPIASCRDDVLLRESGLEQWSGTTARYLVSRSASDAPVFYSWSADAGAQARSGVDVRRRHELYTDLVTAWESLQDGGRQQVRREHPALAAVLADLKADEVESRIVPLNYYESWAVAVAMYDLHFDEFCDLAGGAGADRVGQDLEAGRVAATQGVRHGLAGEGQWLSAPWTPADRVAEIAEEPVRLRRFALESAWLKMHAFVQVCRIVRDYHAGTSCPHLGLSSDNVMLRHAGGSVPAPVRWCFEVGMVDLGASHRLTLDGVGVDRIGPLCLPATDAVRSFVSPWLAEGRRSRTLAMHATAEPADVDGAPAMRVELRSQRERAEGVRAGDVVRIEPDDALPETGEQPLVGRVEQVGKDSVVAVVALTGAALAEGRRFSATATFHRRCGTPCDLFALGMLLARAMLAHDERDQFAVRELWDHVLDRLDTMVGGAVEPAVERVTGALQSLLDGERAEFESSSVLWPKALRSDAAKADAARNGADELLPPWIWRDIIMLMARLLTGYPGFSFAAHHGDVAEDAPAAPVEAVLAAAEELLAALQVERFDAAARDAELTAISGELASRVSSTMVERGGAG